MSESRAIVRRIDPVRVVIVAVAVLFGVVTLLAGGRVLLGSDPGYVVYRPLLLYNTTMGLAYVAAGIMVWRDLTRGKHAAGTIFLLNLLVLIGIVVVFRIGGAVAVDSLRAMSLRTAIWLMLFGATAWRARTPPPRADTILR